MYLKVFIFGGLICVIGQLLIDYTKLTPARILTLFVVSGVILGGLGIYQPLIDTFGCGASIPISGFGNTLAKGVAKAVAEEGFIGIFKGPLTASSAGIGAAIVFGWLAAVIFKPKAKN